jgi:hypothetical protein
LFAEHFKSIAPPGVQVEVKAHHGGQGFLVPISSPMYRAAAKAVSEVYGMDPVPSRGGGSIPILAELEGILQCIAPLMGFGLERDTIHSPNESYLLSQFHKDRINYPVLQVLYTRINIMKWLFLLTFLAGSLQDTLPVRFSAAFDSGCLGEVRRIDSVLVRPPLTDSVLHLSYQIISRSDPDNPANPDLVPSGRWFYFLMENVGNKHIYLNFENTDPKRAVYSYDGKNFRRFEHYQASMRKVSAHFLNDSVYIAYFVPYGWEFLQERLVQWTASHDVVMDTLGYSMLGLPSRCSLLQIVPFRTGIRTVYGSTPGASRRNAQLAAGRLLDKLLSDSPQARAYRKHSVFYVVPFTNPDGVTGGIHAPCPRNQPGSKLGPSRFAYGCRSESPAQPYGLSYT